MNDEAVFASLVQAIGAIVGSDDLVTDLGNPSVTADREALEAMLQTEGAELVVRLWRRPKSLVTSRQLARRDTFAEAARESERNGWPVAIRDSAGLTVAHHPGVLNISHLVSVPDTTAQFSVSRVYDKLLEILIDACRAMGVETDRGGVPGAYCDGSQNLRAQGRKLAGASARMVRRGEKTGILSHASLTVYGSVSEDVAAVQAFERALAVDVNYAPEAHCSLVGMLDEMSPSYSVSLSSSGDRGPRFRSSLGDTPNFSL